MTLKQRFKLTMFIMTGCLIGLIILIIYTSHTFLVILLSIIIMIVFTISLYDMFCDLTNSYPRNKKTEYSFDIMNNINNIIKNDNKLSFYLTENGVWENKEFNLCIDLNGYPFAKSFICSLIIRQFHYAIINKEKLPLKKIYSSLKVSKCFDIESLRLEFDNKNKIHTKHIIKKYKTKVNLLIGTIIESRYGFMGLGGKAHNNRLYKYEKLSEDIYEKEKISKKLRDHIKK